MKDTGFAHDVEWNSELIARFWDNKTLEGNYFSETFGDSLIRLAMKSTGGLKGRVLDYGCGPGILLEKMLQRGIQCEGADTSADSIVAARRRLIDKSRHCQLTQLNGLPSPFPEDSFDVVFFVETIEHIIPTELPRTLQELQRIVRPGGYVVVSTPNEEELKTSQTVCPECGARYHKMQHMSRWTAVSIAVAMEEVGWETVRSRPTLLPQNTLHCRLKAFFSNLVGRKQKHLVYVGRKPIAEANSPFVTPSSSVDHGSLRAA